uniref:Ig-like domain-containing protein n=1 Tax=Electrophorus electricus TaxID=8005 RepID=A0AAY5EW74_ELEEL
MRGNKYPNVSTVMEKPVFVQLQGMTCAYNFYPKKIKVSWLRDGEPVTSDVTATEELADGDWYYQIHSHLEYTPKSGEKISCVVEHASFQKPMVTTPDHS